MSQSGTFGTGGVTPPSGAILQIDADTGSATPTLGGVVNVVGSLNIATIAFINTLQIILEDNVSILGDFTTSGGDFTTTGGNINLPTTLSSGLEGVITINGTPYIHNFGNNIIIGKNAANFTFNTGLAINNTIIGEGSFGSLTTGSNNTIIGEDTMLSGTSASTNTVVGASALIGITSGSGNLALGVASGSNLLTTESNNILIANPGVVADQNTIRIGVDGNGALQQDTCFIAGIIGNNVSNTELVTIDSVTGQLGTTIIDQFADSFAADSGTASPAVGIITIAGGSNIGTTAAGSTVTVNLDDTVSISGSFTAGTTSGFITTETGDITATAGNLNLPFSNSSQGTLKLGGFVFLHGINSENVGLGFGALGTVLTGGGPTARSTAIGALALANSNTSDNTTSIGCRSLLNILTGDNNIALGFEAAQAYTGNESSNIIIGNNGTISESNTIRIGTQGTGAAQQNRCFIAGIVGTTVSNQQFVTINSATGQLGVTASTSFANSFASDSGTATPAASVLTITGGSNIGTTAAGSTVTVNLDNTISVSGSITAGTGLTATTGNVTITAGNLILPTPSTTAGIIYTNGGTDRFIHRFGGTNVFVGLSAGNFTLSGANNCGFGNATMDALTSGQGNAAFGNSNLGSATTATRNTAIGVSVLASLTTGTDNCVVGHSSGSNYTSSESSNILIENAGVAAESNVIRIGTQGSSTGEQDTCYIAGITGSTIVGGATVLCAADGQLGTIVSSERYKENINDIGDKSNNIMSLRPVVFNYKKDESKAFHFGLIAEEVQKVVPELVLYNNDGVIETVAYHELPVLLLNELKKSNKRIEDLEMKLKELL